MDSANKPFIIGTRGSLLALTQAGQVKKQLEELTGKNFEFKVIKTQGDQITDKALWQIDGKDFFTKELDRALIDREIDMVIHSYKDLGSDRPDAIKLSAITKRQYPHDILLIPQSTVEKLKSGSIKGDFIIGTSAPRRIENVTDKIADYLPGSSDLNIECKVLRGNVNSRIEKLNGGEYDAIILALAGLERLAITEESAKALKELTQDLTFKVLNFHDFPPAASQGALALEIHKDNSGLHDLLQIVHCSQTAKAIAVERQRFQTYGGGCHLAVGIHVSPWEDKLIQFEKGMNSNKKIHSKKLVDSQSFDIKAEELFLGFPPSMQELKDKFPQITWDQLGEKESLTPKESDYKSLIVTSSYCLPALNKLNYGSLWAAGHRTHKKLAQDNHWVFADSDSLGIEQIETFMNSKALKIISGDSFDEFQIMSEQTSDYPEGKLLPSYKRFFNPATEEFKKKLETCRHFYWTSFPQFQFYTQQFPEIKKYQHYCGLGKTYSQLEKENIDLNAVVSFKELVNEL